MSMPSMQLYAPLGSGVAGRDTSAAKALGLALVPPVSGRHAAATPPCLALVPRPHARTRSFSMLAAALVAWSVIWAATTLSGLLVRQRLAAAFEGIETTVVVVEEGESLWSLAQSHGVQGATTRETVAWIAARNGLVTRSLSVGDFLEVPLPDAPYATQERQ